MTHEYEIVLILRPEGSDDQIKQEIARVEELLKKDGAQVTTTELWGRRRLAFPIRKQREGVYVMLRVTGEPAALENLKRSFRLDETVVRTLILRADEVTPPTGVAPAMATPGPGRQEWR